MSIIKEYPCLFSVEKNGKTRLWKATVYQTSTHSYASIKHGQLNGKLQESVKEYNSGKNIGKKNETTPLEQCLNETDRKWKDKIEKEGYTYEDEEDEEDEEKVKEKKEKYYPMLAQTYSIEKTRKNDITYPCYVQPKLDGLRCIVYKRNGKVFYQSRTGGLFETMEHLTPSMLLFFDEYSNIIFDGELYTTDMPFEELAGLIKKKKITVNDKEKLKYIQYHIYDIYEGDEKEKQPFEERYKLLKKIFRQKNDIKDIKLVQTLKCESLSEFKKQFSEFVTDGYEGIMLRNINGLYKAGYRSNDLQKYKEFFEDEYPIIGFTEGDGKDKGSVIWICKTKEDVEFKVRPKGNMELRKKWFKDGKSILEKNSL